MCNTWRWEHCGLGGKVFTKRGALSGDITRTHSHTHKTPPYRFPPPPQKQQQQQRHLRFCMGRGIYARMTINFLRDGFLEVLTLCWCWWLELIRHLLLLLFIHCSLRLLVLLPQLPRNGCSWGWGCHGNYLFCGFKCASFPLTALLCPSLTHLCLFDGPNF